MIMGDRIQDYLGSLPRNVHRALIEKQQRTVIRTRELARIVILPNSPQFLRGYTAHRIINDEANFFKDDELVFYNVEYPMLATTDGTLIASSTPWNKDSVFYRMCAIARTTRSYLAIMLDSIDLENLLDRMDEDVALEILVAMAALA
jgi:hypothetical protein